MVVAVTMEEKSLYESEAAALSAPGEIYRHYKGGMYRLVARDVMHTETLELGVVYEHLWPHKHAYFFRTQEMFFDTLPAEKGGGPRFQLVKN